VKKWLETDELYSTEGAPEEETYQQYGNRKIQENDCFRMFFIWPTKRLEQFIDWLDATEQHERKRIAKAVFTALWKAGSRPPLREPLRWTVWLGHGKPTRALRKSRKH